MREQQNAVTVEKLIKITKNALAVTWSGIAVQNVRKIIGGYIKHSV